MFQKAKSEQSKFKINIYGDAGSGKSFTSLLLAEGLTKEFGGQIAVIDSEYGYDFYAETIKARKVHPQAFDFVIEKTKSIFDAQKAVDYAIKSKDISVIIIDSVTQYYKAAQDAVPKSMQKKSGGVALHGWNWVNEQYKSKLVMPLIDCDKHVIFCGRMGNLYSADSNSDQQKLVGKRMKTSGDQAYETHWLFQMTPIVDNNVTTYAMFAEKDRTSILTGKTIHWPGYDNVIKPLLPYMRCKKQPSMNADMDPEIAAEKEAESEKLYNEMSKRISECVSADSIESLQPELKRIKGNLNSSHLGNLQAEFLDKKNSLNQPKKSIVEKINEV